MLSRGLLLQDNHVPDRRILCDCADYALTAALAPKPLPRQGKVPVERPPSLGKGSGHRGLARALARFVDLPSTATAAARVASRACLCAAYRCACLRLLASCGGEPILAPPVGPVPASDHQYTGVAAATPVAPPWRPQFGDIVWATAIDPATNAPIDPVSSYRPDALRIVAAVQTSMRSQPDRALKQPGSTTTPLSTRSPLGWHRPTAAPIMGQLLY